MPPKKKKGKGEEEVKAYLGRPGNNVKMGIVGMPNVGKSLAFNLLAAQDLAASENFPFCTIDPNVSRVIVPDDRFTHLCGVFKPKSEVPAVLNVTDIAGLVKGASEGAGLGNAFLSHIFAVDGIYHLCRAFKNKEIEHVEGNVDPVRDLQIISDELRLKDIERVKTALAPLLKGAGRTADKQKKAQFEMLSKFLEHLEAGKTILSGDWDPKEVELLNTMQLLTAKRIVYLINISMKNFREKKNKWIMPVKKWAAEYSPGSPVIPFSASWEEAYAAMEPEEQKKELEEHQVQSMLPRIIVAGRQALGLATFFTCGKDEVRAWTYKTGWKLPATAGVIHGDFEKCFISADVYNFDQLKEYGTEAEVKKAGKMRMEGKNYTTKDGDILHIKHNA